MRGLGLGVRTEPQVHPPCTIVGIWSALLLQSPAFVIRTGRSSFTPNVINLYPGTTFHLASEFYLCRYRLCRFCKRGASAPLFLAQKTATTKDVSTVMAATYGISEIPSKKHNCDQALIL